MTLEDFAEDRTMDTPTRRKLSRTLVSVLRRAQVEQRLTCALGPAIRLLETAPERALFCILPQSRQGDAALHIHLVLLRAFCYENNIRILQVDSAEKLGALVSWDGGPRQDCSCVVVASPHPWATDQERELAQVADGLSPPVIQLPES